MKINKLKISGAFLIETEKAEDSRGFFVKIFNGERFLSAGIKNTIFRELYYSISHKDVIRGMHFHLPPHAHAKLVYVPCGCITDVMLDLRKKSKTFGKCEAVILNDKNCYAIYIPEGIAHGFLSMQNGTIVVYQQTGPYVKEYDAGIAYNSFGYNWGIKDPVLSGRDTGFAAFKYFKSPF